MCEHVGFLLRQSHIINDQVKIKVYKKLIFLKCVLIQILRIILYSDNFVVNYKIYFYSTNTGYAIKYFYTIYVHDLAMNTNLYINNVAIGH